MAAAKGCRPGQLALAWLLAQPSDFVPIPGTKRVKYVQENIAAASVAVNADEIAYLGEVFAPSRIVGERYTAPTRIQWLPQPPNLKQWRPVYPGQQVPINSPNESVIPCW